MPPVLQKASPQGSQVLKEREKVLSPPSVEEDQDRHNLGKLDTHKCMVSNGVQPVGAEGAVAMPLSIIFDKSWGTGEVPEDRRKASVTAVLTTGKKEDPRN